MPSSVATIIGYNKYVHGYIPSSYVSSKDMNWVRGLVNLKVLRLSGVDLSVASSATNWAEPISFLARLKDLHLSNCNISGSIPTHEFLNLSRLSSLRMDYNYNFLNSSIPIQLANLTSLSILDFTNCGLQGSIPYLPQLSELYAGDNPDLDVSLSRMFDDRPWPKLQTLLIVRNKVIGSIPSSISNASLLVNLDASNCSIQGSLPISISNLSQLQYLHLGYNNISGHLPDSISNLRNLQYLIFRRNHLQGPIPKSICEISSLLVLQLEGNGINGTIPSCISKLRNLNAFDVIGNHMMGTVPLNFFIRNCLNLTWIGFSDNRITIEIDQYLPLPSQFQPKVLELRSCNLKGYIPGFICNLTQLEQLDLSGNNLTGAIPSCLFQLPHLSFLNLSSNNLQGTLPHSLDPSVFLELILANNKLGGHLPLPPQNVFILDLSKNEFIGGISTEFGERLSIASYLYLSDNKLSGSIPSSICSKEYPLLGLDLSNNQLSGTIPSSLQYCDYLFSLKLGMNHLTGNVPNQLKWAKHIKFLQLNDNALNGTFPSFIQQLEDLIVLKLGNNRFGCPIPTFIGSLPNLQILSLRSNEFNGSIPKEITHLPKLQILDLSINNLSGPIPDKIGNLEMLTRRPNHTDAIRMGYFSQEDVQLEMVIKGTRLHLERLYSYNSGIDLSCNILDGNIPQEIVLLKGLSMLNLSHNRFSGMIPMNVGNMTGLESLDLSFNKFSGHIPQSLTSIDSLGSLKLSYNNLSGRIPTGPHFDTLSVDGSAYVGNTFLCGPPTSNSCEGDVNTSTPTDASLQKDKDEDEEDASEKWLFYVVIFLGYGVGFWGLFFVLLVRKEKWWCGYWRVVDIVASRLMVGCMRKNS